MQDAALDEAQQSMPEADEAACDKPDHLMPEAQAAGDKPQQPQQLMPEAQAAGDKPQQLMPEAQAAGDKPQQLMPEAEAALDKPQQLTPEAEAALDKPEQLMPEAKAALDKPQQLMPEAHSAADLTHADARNKIPKHTKQALDDLDKKFGLVTAQGIRELFGVNATATYGIQEAVQEALHEDCSAAPPKKKARAEAAASWTNIKYCHLVKL